VKEFDSSKEIFFRTAIRVEVRGP